MANSEQDREARLAQVIEPALEPELPIVDPHHHLWDHPDSRYMLDEILRDINSGHRVLATVFVECMSMYRADGPESNASGGRDRVRQRYRGPKREWPIWRDSHRGGNRRLCGFDTGRSNRASA